MQVKILRSMAGVGFSYRPNQLIDIEDSEAARMCAAGLAEAVKSAKRKATVKPKEKAITE